MVILIKDGEFVDEHGRILNLRGVNVAGSSKIPYTSNNISSGTNGGKDVTFVGRPFSLSEASLHFTRLRACGYTFIRFIVTWEAIEHAGPGIYDTEYLDYIRQVLEKAKEFGIRVFIDPHQDVWSRWTGGDGAPLWTLEVVGFDVDNFPLCDAALCQQTYGQGQSTPEQEFRRAGAAGGGSSGNDGEIAGTLEFPKMIWPTNYFKLACATMFTLFWAGKRLAPQFMVNTGKNGEEKINIQTYLQTRYINAMAELLKRLIGLDNIVGIGTMNEPHSGYINVADISRGFDQSLKYGLTPTPFQGMCLGEGHAQKVREWSNGMMQYILGRPDRWVMVDPKGKKAWKDHGPDSHGGNSNGCVWRQAGVWDINAQTLKPELLQPHYFANIDFGNECYVPFAADYANAMRAVWKTPPPSESPSQPLLIFLELQPVDFSLMPFPQISSKSHEGLVDVVNASHWYDGITVFTKSWRSYFSFNTQTLRPLFGYNSIFKTHVSHIAAIKRLGTENMENSPTLIGECGIPFDMNGGKSYRGSGSKCANVNGAPDSFGQQTTAMDHTIRCMEANLASFTLWNYTPDNTNAEGDLWNGEDLSIFSAEQKIGRNEEDPYFIYDGLRAARAVVRPFAQCISAQPLENKFDMKKRVFTYRGISNVGGETMKVDAPTEIFVPKLWCMVESDMKISISQGRFEVEEQKHWFTVKYWPSESEVEHSLEIRFT
ncbi:hypothetical protein ACHAWU_001367 [Discostella pseudostelligera]|uniref:Uncharacterized protein n=1 Tax=Discostella pseudostelligera TaxID=259834 RepID=A0ABD3MBE0_9STRA